MQKASKESLGEVNQDLQSTKDTINDIIVTPAELDINLISTTRSQTDRNGAFVVVTINRDDREVFLTRFGDGEDRTYTY